MQKKLDIDTPHVVQSLPPYPYPPTPTPTPLPPLGG